MDGFAFAPEALTNVSSPATLDRIVSNCLAIRLKDHAMAEGVYQDIRDRVLRANGRRRDVQISVSLAPWTDGPSSGKNSMLVATVRWEYWVTPASPTLRFACVSDADEHRELLQDPATTVAWRFDPVGDLDASAKEVFEVVQCTVNGKPRPVRRTKRAGAQIFTVASGIPEDAAHEQRLSYTYKVLVQQDGNLLYLDLGKPTNGLKVELWTGNCGIRHVNVLDFIAGAKQPTVLRTPPSVPSQNIVISYDGWVFPRSGVAFVWVLERQFTAKV